jgi:hypothetical protein
VRIHLVELVNAADAVVSKHEGSGLDDELGALLILDDGRRQTGSSTRFAGSVDGTRTEVGNLKNNGDLQNRYKIVKPRTNYIYY